MQELRLGYTGRPASPKARELEDSVKVSIAITATLVGLFAPALALAEETIDPKPAMRTIGLVGVFAQLCAQPPEQGGVRITFTAPLVGKPTRALTFRMPGSAGPPRITTGTDEIVASTLVADDRIQIVTEQAGQRTTSVLQKIGLGFRVMFSRGPDARLDVNDGIMAGGGQTVPWQKCSER
jgi:hypothetical protein